MVGRVFVELRLNDAMAGHQRTITGILVDEAMLHSGS